MPEGLKLTIRRAKTLGAKLQFNIRMAAGRERAGCSAIDFQEGCVAQFHPLTIGLVVAALAFDDGRIEEARGQASQAAMSANGALEAGERGAQVVDCAPARADGVAGGAPDRWAAGRTEDALMCRHDMRAATEARSGSALPFVYHFFTANRGKEGKGRLAFPVLDLVVVFILRDVADGRSELDWAGGLLNLAAEVAGDRIELRG